VTSPASARCTTHSDAQAEASCARCGDFVCRLCGPLEPVALCPRCALKTTLEFEEPGESTLARAFYVTARDAVGSPSRMGERLGGSGHVLTALSFVTVAALLGLVPLSLILAAPLLAVADAVRLGLRSTGVLSVGVSVVLLAVALATLLALSVLVFTSWVRLAARITGIHVRSDVLLRATSYGLSLLALPVLGPVLLPVAFAQALLATHAALAMRATSQRAALTLVLACTIGLVELGLVAAVLLPLLV
jgi:hypothetical protein